MPLTTLRVGVDPVHFFAPNWLVATRIQFDGDRPVFTHVPMDVHTMSVEARITRETLEDSELTLSSILATLLPRA